MPLYEYQCDECGARLERIQKFSDPPLDRCPTCNGTLRKLISSPAIQFKGSGWYITDYARKPDAARDQADKAEKSETAEKKTDAAAKADGAAKPATTAPAAAGDSGKADSSSSDSKKAGEAAPKAAAKG